LLLSAAVCACLLLTDDKRARQVTKVAEAEGAKYTGIVILLVTLLPVVVLIGLDVFKMAKQRKKCNKHNKRRTLTDPRRKFSESVF